MLGRDELDRLLDAIRRRGFRLVGPVLEDGAICYGDISSAADLPAGWTDEQDAATYRLRHRDDQALFGYNVGPQSWKKYLFPAVARLGAPARPDASEPERRAFIGVRACELRAIEIQDRVFTGGRHPDPAMTATGTAIRSRTIATSRITASIRSVRRRSGLRSKPSRRAQRARRVPGGRALGLRITAPPPQTSGLQQTVSGRRAVGTLGR